jgi:hypothetical protein
VNNVERLNGRVAALLLLFAALGIELDQSHGMYQFFSLVVLSLSMALVIVPSFLDRRAIQGWSRTGAFWGIGLIFAYHMARGHEMAYASTGLALTVVGYATIAGALALLAAGLAYWGAASRKWTLGAVAVGASAYLTAMFAVLWASPDPHIDVFTQLTEASGYLGEGLNPYAQDFPSVYGGRFDYPQGLNYPPGSLLWVAPFEWLVGEVRIGHILAELVGLAGLWTLGRQSDVPSTDIGIIALVWLAFPVRLFVLEQSWIDAFIIAYLPWLLVCLKARRWLWAGVVLGLICGIKQYVFFVALLSCLAVWLAEGPSRAIRMGLACTGTFLVQVVPFALLDWGSFYYHVFGHYLELGPRGDALTWVAYSMKSHQFTPPGWMMTVVYLGTCAALASWFAGDDELAVHKLTFALVIQYGMTFLFGKQAFCNYYYLLAFLVLLAVITDDSTRSDSHG